MKTYKGLNRIVQGYSADGLMAAYADYARSIGCHVDGDSREILTVEQAELLSKKWKELTRQTSASSLHEVGKTAVAPSSVRTVREDRREYGDRGNGGANLEKDNV